MEAENDTLTPDQPQAEPQVSEDEALGEIWDKAQGQLEDEPSEAEPGEVQEGADPAEGRDEKGRFKAKEPTKDEDDDKVEDKPEPSKEEMAMLGNLPFAIQQNWENIPEEAKTALLEHHKRLSSTASEAGRLAKGLAPIRDVLSEATQHLPELANMRPEEVAQDVMELAKTRAQLMRDPVGTLIATARQMGAEGALRNAFTGQQGQNQQGDYIARLERRVAELEGTAKKAPNDDIIRGTVDQAFEQRAFEQEVAGWASELEHFSAVERQLPMFIQMVSEDQPELSPRDKLVEAYNMAIRARGPRATEPQAAEQPPANAAPQRSEAALKAKSVNVKSRGTRPSELSEEDALGAAYERIMRN